MFVELNAVVGEKGTSPMNRRMMLKIEIAAQVSIESLIDVSGCLILLVT